MISARLSLGQSISRSLARAPVEPGRQLRGRLAPFVLHCKWASRRRLARGRRVVEGRWRAGRADKTPPNAANKLVPSPIQAPAAGRWARGGVRFVVRQVQSAGQPDDEMRSFFHVKMAASQARQTPLSGASSCRGGERAMSAALPPGGRRQWSSTGSRSSRGRGSRWRRAASLRGSLALPACAA